jgi:hypothetical protein
MQKKHGLQKFEKNVNNMQAIQLGPNANNKAQNTLDLMFRTFPLCPNVNLELNGIVIKEKYRVQGFIRGGAFGDVFFAKHVQKNYDVAVKFVSDMHT